MCHIQQILQMSLLNFILGKIHPSTMKLFKGLTHILYFLHFYTHELKIVHQFMELRPPMRWFLMSFLVHKNFINSFLV